MRLRYLARSATIAVLIVIIAFAWTATLFAQIVAAISIENIGVITGLPFGVYHFTVGADLPRIGVIPFVVGGLWFGMGYCSWVAAGARLDHADARLNEEEIRGSAEFG
jgi:putative membrane protein